MTNKDFLFTLSEGEWIVRTFELTRLKRFFAEDAVGFLSITNQRVIYHSSVKSSTGESQLLSEMPLDDVAGLSTSMNASFNFVFFLFFTVALYFVNQILFGVLPEFLTHWVVGLILSLPYGITFLFEKQIFSQEIRVQAEKNLKGFTSSLPLQGKDASSYRPLFWILFLAGIDLIVFNIAFSPRLAYRSEWLSWLVILAGSFLIYRVIFGRCRVFAMQINSRTAKGSGIKIHGDPLAKVLGGDNSAAQTLQAGPGRDANEAIRELGAMLTDIRLLGDLGIQKWTKARAD